MTVLNDCALLLIVDGIKQTSGLAELKIKVNSNNISSDSEDTMQKLTFLRLTHSGKFSNML